MGAMQINVAAVSISALVLLCLLGCAGTRPAQLEEQLDQEADVAAIRAVSDARAEAFRKGDAAGIAIHFTEDGVLMAPGEPASRGRASVRAYYQKIFDEFEPGLESGFAAVGVDGDLAYGQGYAKVTLRPRKGGPPTESTAKYINILQRRPDGSWKTTHDIWNANE